MDKVIHLHFRPGETLKLEYHMSDFLAFTKENAVFKRNGNEYKMDRYAISFSSDSTYIVDMFFTKTN